MMLHYLTKSIKNLVKVAEDDLIQFYCDPALFDVIPHPTPASKCIAPWFKSIKPIVDTGRDQFDAKGMSAKKCMPLLDAMTAGWIIPLFGDVNVATNDDCSIIDAGKNPLGPIIESHSLSQLGNKTSPTYPGHAIKFINPWIIKTKPGISSFFMPPVNHFEKRFTCFSGLVDTDAYAKQVNFPAIWHINNHDDVISAGTPLVTVIPVHRDDLEYKATPRKMTKEEFEFADTLGKKQQSRRHVYTNEVRANRK
jgi:hypothetical protein